MHFINSRPWYNVVVHDGSSVHLVLTHKNQIIKYKPDICDYQNPVGHIWQAIIPNSF
jgi:hypothetical protein